MGCSTLWIFSCDHSYILLCGLISFTQNYVQFRHISVHACCPLGGGGLAFHCGSTGHRLMSVSTSSFLVNIWVVSLDLYQEVALMFTECKCILHLWPRQMHRSNLKPRIQRGPRPLHSCQCFAYHDSLPKIVCVEASCCVFFQTLKT